MVYILKGLRVIGVPHITKLSNVHRGSGICMKWIFSGAMYIRTQYHTVYSQRYYNAQIYMCMCIKLMKCTLQAGYHCSLMITSPLSLSLSLSNKTQNAHNCMHRLTPTDVLVYKNYQLLRWCVSKYLEHFGTPCDILDSCSEALLATFPYLDSLIYTATNNIRSWLVKICTGRGKARMCMIIQGGLTGLGGEPIVNWYKLVLL